jgi:hypothetical protein
MIAFVVGFFTGLFVGMAIAVLGMSLLKASTR